MSTPVETWAKDMKNTPHQRLKLPVLAETGLHLLWLGISFYAVYQLRKVSKSLNVNTLWLSDPLLEIYALETSAQLSRERCTRIFLVVLFTI